MEKEMLDFIRKNSLSPFSKCKTSVKSDSDSIYLTKDAKSVHNKLFSVISENFSFPDSSCLLNFFAFTGSEKEILRRQKFFSGIKGLPDNSPISALSAPRNWWSPKYGVIVVTEDEKTFKELQNLECPVKFLTSEYDLNSLENYDIVQVIDCENFSRTLESLPQSVFLDSTDEVYLERYLKCLSGWSQNLSLLSNMNLSEPLNALVKELSELSSLLEDEKRERLTVEKIESALSDINSKVSAEMKNLTISGDALMGIFSKNQIPEDLMKIIRLAIKESGFPEHLFIKKIPVSLDEELVEKEIKSIESEQHASTAERIKEKSSSVRMIPERLASLSDNLILFDFLSGICKYSSKADSFPETSNVFSIDKSRNIFLDKAQPISFILDESNRCSILTGANSGGKTTLLEHIIQVISLSQMGLPVSGKVSMPLFSEVYYFAKNKGSANKGAFETLLTQMSKIKTGEKTLILADEIESVTEPGVAGAIICASADFFIKRGCFLVIATHLGKEIQKNLPKNARVDGIEAKGLDEFYELIVDHNPVLGRLANSTPELIVEKMANSFKTEYFGHLNEFLKRSR